MKLARDVYGWPRIETRRLHIELGPDWLWHPMPKRDDDGYPVLYHMFFGFISVTWVSTEGGSHV